MTTIPGILEKKLLWDCGSNCRGDGKRKELRALRINFKLCVQNLFASAKESLSLFLSNSNQTDEGPSPPKNSKNVEESSAQSGLAASNRS